MSFLNAGEINKIFKDFDDLLNSPEAITVTVRWITAHSAAWDPVYRQYPDTDVPTWATQDIKIILQVIRPTDKSYLDSGILKVGDIVLYCDRSYTFSAKPDMELIYRGKTYYPIIPTPTVLELLGVALGTQQIAQILFCTQVKEKE